MSGTRADHTDRETREWIPKGEDERAKQNIVSDVVLRLLLWTYVLRVGFFDVSWNHIGDDNTVGGFGIAENDRRKVLRVDSGRFHTTQTIGGPAVKSSGFGDDETF